MYCRNCGKELDNNAAFCPVCGVKTGEHTYAQPVVHVVNNNSAATSGKGSSYIPKTSGSLSFSACSSVALGRIAST